MTAESEGSSHDDGVEKYQKLPYLTFLRAPINNPKMECIRTLQTSRFWQVQVELNLSFLVASGPCTLHLWSATSAGSSTV